MTNRRELLRQYGFYYKRPCTYCGHPADTKDHVPSLGWLETMGPTYFREQKIPIIIVPCCLRCNSFLSARKLFTVNERAALIKENMPIVYQVTPPPEPLEQRIVVVEQKRKLLKIGPPRYFRPLELKSIQLAEMEKLDAIRARAERRATKRRR